MAKVLLFLEIIRKNGIFLEQKQILDYGFGAGTLLAYLPKTARLAGVEQDPVACREAHARLRRLGYEQVDLQPLSQENGRSHPLLLNRYDLVVCSHVLEHLERPAELLEALGENLSTGGLIVALVPLNERKENPHHLQKTSRAVIEEWARAAKLKLVFYWETDPWLYWIQPLFAWDHGWQHRLGQGVNLLTGIFASAIGARLWFALGRVFGGLTGSRPTQAGFILSPE